MLERSPKRRHSVATVIMSEAGWAMSSISTRVSYAPMLTVTFESTAKGFLASILEQMGVDDPVSFVDSIVNVYILTRANGRNA